MTTSPIVGFVYLEDPQDHAEVKVNEACNLLEATIQCSVLDMSLLTPPGSPTPGERHIVGVGTATGDWVGKNKQITVFNGGWLFVVPKIGWEIYNQDDGLRYRHDGTNWVALYFGAPVRTDSTRGTGVVQGQQIFNSDDGFINVWNGTTWTQADGTPT